MTVDHTHIVKRVALIVTVLASATVVGIAAFFLLSGGPLANEMACSEGQAPANTEDGGSACFTEGTELPRGFTWDPRGNHAIN